MRTSAGRTVSYRSVLAVRDFRWMWLAELLSVTGDQVARVALSVLVFQRTGSAALTGLTYGLTFLPSLFGSIALGGLADRFPRRTVMIVCDLVRFVLIGLVAVPGIPLWLLCALVASSTVANGPFRAGQQALLPSVLPDDRYLPGMALRTTTVQSAQLAGFVVGGALVVLLTPAGSLLLDSVTFLASALLLLRVRRSAAGHAGRAPALSGLVRGAAAYRADPRLVVLVCVVALNLFHIVPEGLAAPFAATYDAPAYVVGLVQACAPLGGIAAALVFGRLVPDHLRARLVGPAAVGAGVALAAVALPVGTAGSLALFVVAGGLSAVYTLYATATIVTLAPDAHRAQIAGLQTAVLATANGLGPALAGLVAGVTGARAAIAAAGAVSVLLALLLGSAWRRVDRTTTTAASVAGTRGGGEGETTMSND